MAYRVLLAQFMHETNTFSRLKTTLDDYRRRFLVEGEGGYTIVNGERADMRRGDFIDDAFAQGIRQCAFQPVADLETHGVIVLGDQE